MQVPPYQTTRPRIPDNILYKLYHVLSFLYHGFVLSSTQSQTYNSPEANLLPSTYGRHTSLYCCALLNILLDIIPSRRETDATSAPEVCTSSPFVIFRSNFGPFCFGEERKGHNEHGQFHCRPGRILLQSDRNYSRCVKTQWRTVST
jgi:hypothetical protein